MDARLGEAAGGSVDPVPATIAELLARPPQEQQALGYLHTVREIHQQPDTWIATARTAVAEREWLLERLAAAGIPDGHGSIVLTGSGSSHYVGEAVARGIQRALRVPVAAVASGEILTHL